MFRCIPIPFRRTGIIPTMHPATIPDLHDWGLWILTVQPMALALATFARLVVRCVAGLLSLTSLLS